MEEKMRQSFSKHDEAGQIYVYTPIDYDPTTYDSAGPNRPFPRLGESELPIKVGYSKNVTQRLKDHESLCKYTAHKLHVSQMVQMKNFAERLIHLELQGRKFQHIKYSEPEQCRACKTMHREFFVGKTYAGDGEMGLGKAMAEIQSVISLWVAWVNYWALDEAKRPGIPPAELYPLILTSEKFEDEQAQIELVSDSEEGSVEIAEDVREYNLSRNNSNVSLSTISTDSDTSEYVSSSPYRSSMELQASASNLEVEFAPPSATKGKGTMKSKETVIPEQVRPLRRSARLLAKQSKPDDAEVVDLRSSMDGMALGASSSSTLPPPPPVRRTSSIISSVQSSFSSINYFQTSAARATKKGKGKGKASPLTTTTTAKSTTAPNSMSNPPIAASNEAHDNSVDGTNFSPINHFQSSRGNGKQKGNANGKTPSTSTISTASKTKQPMARPRQTPPQHQPNSNSKTFAKINVVIDIQEALTASNLLPARVPLGAMPSNVIAKDDNRAIALARAMMTLKSVSLVVGNFFDPVKPKKSNGLNSGMAGGQENGVPVRANVNHY